MIRFLFQAYIKKNLQTSSIEVKVQYKQNLCDKFKTINGKEFDCITGIWSFPLGELSKVSGILEEECDQVNSVKWFPVKETRAKYIPLKE